MDLMDYLFANSGYTCRKSLTQEIYPHTTIFHLYRSFLLIGSICIDDNFVKVRIKGKEATPIKFDISNPHVKDELLKLLKTVYESINYIIIIDS